MRIRVNYDVYYKDCGLTFSELFFISGENKEDVREKLKVEFKNRDLSPKKTKFKIDVLVE